MCYDTFIPYMGQERGELSVLNKNALRGKIAESGLTQGKVADAIGISPNTFTRKISGKRDFTVSEIDKLCLVLNISDPQQKVNIFLQQATQ